MCLWQAHRFVYLWKYGRYLTPTTTLGGIVGPPPGTRIGSHHSPPGPRSCAPVSGYLEKRMKGSDGFSFLRPQLIPTVLGVPLCCRFEESLVFRNQMFTHRILIEGETKPGRVRNRYISILDDRLIWSFNQVTPEWHIGEVMFKRDEIIGGGALHSGFHHWCSWFGCHVHWQSPSGNVNLWNGCPTKRGVDLWESERPAAGISLASGFSCSQSESKPAHRQDRGPGHQSLWG
jgi:hypothetical protein